GGQGRGGHGAAGALGLRPRCYRAALRLALWTRDVARGIIRAEARAARRRCGTRRAARDHAWRGRRLQHRRRRRRGLDRQGARRAWLRSALSRAVNRGGRGRSFAKASPSCGQGVTFFVNYSLIVLRACNTAKTLTSEWESGRAAPRFGHTRP